MGGPIGLLFDPSRPRLACAGDGGDFGAAFAKSQAAAMNPRAVLHGGARTSARGQTFTCP
ncbi:MAG TPA: hypothetical protein VIF02_01575 [Methylocella sp.]